MQQTRDQRYATAIFQQVEKVDQETKSKIGNDKTYRDAYGSMAHKLPVLIRTAGLAQALAFVQARGKKIPAPDGRTPHHDLLTHLSQVVRNGKEDLCTQSRIADLSEYMHLTHESLAALLWFKRFAQSVLDVEDASRGDKLMEDDNV